MNKIFIVAAFFMLLLSSEIVMITLGLESHEISLKELATDGESEKGGKERFEENSKVEILLAKDQSQEEGLSKHLIYSKESLINHPYLDQATPPPEV
jgi:hypothetical protein